MAGLRSVARIGLPAPESRRRNRLVKPCFSRKAASGAGGENAKSLMSDVEKNAGTIASAFEAQLDALFAGEVLDVSSDIAVLDGMLSGDGLSGKNNLKLS